MILLHKMSFFYLNWKYLKSVPALRPCDPKRKMLYKEVRIVYPNGQIIYGPTSTLMLIFLLYTRPVDIRTKKIRKYPSFG